MDEGYHHFSIETVDDGIYAAIPDGGSNAGIVNLGDLTLIFDTFTDLADELSASGNSTVPLEDLAAPSGCRHNWFIQNMDFLIKRHSLHCKRQTLDTSLLAQPRDTMSSSQSEECGVRVEDRVTHEMGRTHSSIPGQRSECTILVCCSFRQFAQPALLAPSGFSSRAPRRTSF